MDIVDDTKDSKKNACFWNAQQNFFRQNDFEILPKGIRFRHRSEEWCEDRVISFVLSYQGLEHFIRKEGVLRGKVHQ